MNLISLYTYLFKMWFNYMLSMVIIFMSAGFTIMLIVQIGPCMGDNLNIINCFIKYWIEHLIALLLIIIGACILIFIKSD